MSDIAICEDDLLDRVVLVEHAGLSGAELSRARLRDGTGVVVKRSSPSHDLFQRLLGHSLSLEHVLWQDGTLRALPAGVRSATIASWADGDTTTIVMEDLGDRILGSEHVFSAEEAVELLKRIDRMHRARLAPSAATSLHHLLTIFSPERLRGVKDGAELAGFVERGWAAFAHLAPERLTSAVAGLVQHPERLVAALDSRPAAFCHGDVAAVNLAWAGNDLVLVDWGQAFVGPPALDVARFLPSGLVRSQLDPDWFLGRYAGIAGDHFDRKALDLALLATLVWFGWKKALDATEAPNSEHRERETEALAWWFDVASRGIGLLSRQPG